MKPQKAINTLKAENDLAMLDPYTGEIIKPSDFNQECIDAHLIAIDAIEHHMMAKFPENRNGDLFCPSCGAWLMWEDSDPCLYDTYCGCCGQKMKYEVNR